MATTGPALTIPFTVGSSAVVGQGLVPQLWVLYTTDDASVSTPTWVDATADVRSVSVSRGRDTELAEIDAGTCTLVLGNRARTYDPTNNALIRPLNRWWIREQFTGETQDLFKGYAESYHQQWPDYGGSDAETVVACADEFKVLALDKLPVMSPPRDTYQDLVMSDEPTVYWSFDDDTLDAVTGARLRKPAGGGWAVISDTAIAGAPYTADSPGGRLHLGSGNRIDAESSDAGDTMGINLATIELWFFFPGVPAANFTLAQGPQDPTLVSHCWSVVLGTSGAVSVQMYNGASFLTAISGVLTASTWYHVVGTLDGTNLQLWINGTNVATTGWSGTTGVSAEGQDPLHLGSLSSTAAISVDEFAFYRGRALNSGRIMAHYTAGTARGYRQHAPGYRAGAVLDTVGNHAPRRVTVGSRTMQSVFMAGQPPLDELRRATRAEAPDGLLFVGRDGTIVFLDAAHRSSSPYNTVQATFDDDGTDLPYLDVTVDYSEAFLFNDWNVTRAGRAAVLQNAQDTTSTGRYFKRSQSVTDLPLTVNADAATVATALLAKYKDPMTRVTSITLTTHMPDVAEAVFRRDIGDRIRVFRTPPGGGSRIDQSLWIQKIEIAKDNQSAFWTVRWGVSPL